MPQPQPIPVRRAGIGGPPGSYGGVGPVTPVPTPGAAGGTGTLTNTAPENPRLAGWMQNYGNRLTQMQARPTVDPNREFLMDEYKKRLSADTTQRAIDKASSNIRDQASGAQKEMRDQFARTGEAMPANLVDKAASDTQRRQAGAAADITMAREKDLDNLVMGGSRIMESPGDYAAARDNELSAFTMGGLPGAQAVASNQLAERGLNLNQWEAENSNAMADAELQQRLLGQRMALNRLRGGRAGGVGSAIGRAA